MIVTGTDHRPPLSPGALHGPAPAGAALRLLACAAVLVAALLASTHIASPPRAGEKGGDGVAFQQVVERMRTGVPYYTAMGSILRHSGYPSASVFNWRTPLLYEALAALPSWTWGRAVLTMLALAAAVAMCIAGAEVSRLSAVGTGLAAVGVVVMMSAPAAVGMAEAWAGSLIALSVAAFATRHRRAGVVLGLGALSLRELAAPYCLACSIAAARERHRSEVVFWVAGALAYLAAYWFHWNRVGAHHMPGDVVQGTSWIAWGGLPFLLSTLRWHGALLLLPPAYAAISLALIVAGLLSPRAPVHLRLSAGLYTLMFLVVGQAFNDYWGFLAWPSWCLAIGIGVHAVVIDIRLLIRRFRVSYSAVP